MLTQREQTDLRNRVIALFEGEEVQAAQWLNTPNVGLGQVSPAAYARDHTTYAQVLQLIGRLEQGVF